MNNPLGRIALKAKQDKYFICHSIFPFQLFPDSIILDDTKLTIIRRGFLTREVIPIKLPDLLNVEIHEAPLFCTVEIVAKFVTARHEKLTYFSKQDGRELQRRCVALIVENSDKDSSGGQ